MTRKLKRINASVNENGVVFYPVGLPPGEYEVQLSRVIETTCEEDTNDLDRRPDLLCDPDRRL